MKALRLFLMLLATASLSLITTSCEEEAKNEVEGQGANFVRLPDATESPKLVLIELKPGTITVPLAEILRDANSEVSLNSPVTVNLKIDQALLNAYNATIDTADWLELLPATLYQADPLDINMAAGDFSKFFNIKFDPSKLDPAKSYALPLSIAGASNDYKIRSGLGGVVYQFLIKNQYDGKYKVTGSMVDLSNAALTGLYPLTFDLISNGASQVVVSDRDVLGFPGHPILSGGSPSYYGSFGLILDFDDATGKITAIKNYYGTPPNYVSGNGRSAELDPSGVNTYDKATKTIKIKYWMNQPSVITPHRTAFDETWVYDGDR